MYLIKVSKRKDGSVIEYLRHYIVKVKVREGKLIIVKSDEQVVCNEEGIPVKGRIVTNFSEPYTYTLDQLVKAYDKE